MRIRFRCKTAEWLKAAQAEPGTLSSGIALLERLAAAAAGNASASGRPPRRVERLRWQLEPAGLWNIQGWSLPSSELGLRFALINRGGIRIQYLALPSTSFASLLWMELRPNEMLQQRVAMESSMLTRTLFNALGETRCMHSHRLAMGWPMPCISRLGLKLFKL